jgi:hypothetical protein
MHCKVAVDSLCRLQSLHLTHGDVATLTLLLHQRHLCRFLLLDEARIQTMHLLPLTSPGDLGFLHEQSYNSVNIVHPFVPLQRKPYHGT